VAYLVWYHSLGGKEIIKKYDYVLSSEKVMVAELRQA
jgi:hypothetical protein